MTTTLFERSLEVQELAVYLSGLPVNQVCKYSELSEVLCQDVTKPKGRAKLESAKQIVLSEHGLVFQCVRGVGIKRLEKEQVVASVLPDTVRKIRSATRKGKKIISKGISPEDYKTLSKDGQAAYNATVSLLNVTDQISRSSQIKSVEKSVRETNAPLNLGKTLEAFGMAPQA